MGSPKEVDMEKEGELIRSLAQMALSKIDDIDDDLSRRKLLAIVGAKKQVHFIVLLNFIFFLTVSYCVESIVMCY